MGSASDSMEVGIENTVLEHVAKSSLAEMNRRGIVSCNDTESRVRWPRLGIVRNSVFTL